MKYLFLVLRVLLFLAAVGGLCYIYFWSKVEPRLMTKVLFWALLASTSAGLWMQYKALKR